MLAYLHTEYQPDNIYWTLNKSVMNLWGAAGYFSIQWGQVGNKYKLNFIPYNPKNETTGVNATTLERMEICTPADLYSLFIDETITF